MNIYFLIACFIFCFPLKAEIIVEYKISIGKENPLVDKSFLIPDRMTVSFNDKFARVQTISSSAIASRFDLYKIGQKFYYFCADFMNDKKAFKTQKPNYEIQYPHDSTFNIIGYKCRKAVGKSERGNIEIYYTDYFGVHFFPEGDLNGIALKYKKSDKLFESISYEAVSIRVGNLPSELFSLKNYTVLNASSKKKFENWVGKKLPPILVDDLNGTKSTLKTSGKIFVINFWFLGCTPCRMEIPYLNELVKIYSNDPRIQFIAIALDKPDDINDFLSKDVFFDYKLFGNGKKAAIKCRVSSFPTHYVLDQNGLVVGEWNSYTPLTIAEINEIIKKTLN